MKTQDFLELIANAAFDPAFQEEIQNTYQRDVDKGMFRAEETEYTEAKHFLSHALPQAKLELLCKYEDSYFLLRGNFARHGFLAGVFSGFKQYFTTDCAIDGGFSKYVDDEIATMPNMERHQECYTHILRCNALYNDLCQGESDVTQSHIINLDCTLRQRARSASINGFYSGYRGAVAIIDKVTPPTGGSHQMIDKFLTMAHQLGCTTPYDEE